MMSRILFIGDPHLDSRTPLSRLDDYRVTTINKLDNLLTLAVRKKAKYVVMTGDMFHRSDIPMSYLNEVLRMLKKFKAEGVEVYSLIGNHDLPHNISHEYNYIPPLRHTHMPRPHRQYLPLQ
jgi:DNA repair exonuclease SbcCD nuclease subunit